MFSSVSFSIDKWPGQHALKSSDYSPQMLFFPPKVKVSKNNLYLLEIVI